MINKRIWKEGENNYPKSTIKNKKCPKCGVKAVLCGGCGYCRVCCDIGKFLIMFDKKEGKNDQKML